MGECTKLSLYEILTGLLTLFFVNVHIIGYTYIQFTDVEQGRTVSVFGKVPAWTTK